MKLLRADGYNESECAHVQTFYYMFLFHINEIARNFTAMLFVVLRFDNQPPPPMDVPSIQLSIFISFAFTLSICACVT